MASVLRDDPAIKELTKGYPRKAQAAQAGVRGHSAKMPHRKTAGAIRESGWFMDRILGNSIHRIREAEWP